MGLRRLTGGTGLSTGPTTPARSVVAGRMRTPGETTLRPPICPEKTTAPYLPLFKPRMQDKGAVRSDRWPKVDGTDGSLERVAARYRSRPCRLCVNLRAAPSTPQAAPQ